MKIRGGDRKLRKTVGLIILVVGLALVFYPQIEKKMVYDREQQILIDSFEQLGQTELLQQLSTDAEDILKVEDIAKAKNSIASNGSAEKKRDELEGARGIVRIERIDLEMIVFDGATASNLSKGAAIVESKKQFGINNVGLAGHRALVEGKQFNRLDELELSDVIEVTTRDRVFEYEVIRKFVVPKNEISVLDDTGTPLITLITCTPLGQSNPPNRLIVQAALKK